jgi:hypothetical protein
MEPQRATPPLFGADIIAILFASPRGMRRAPQGGIMKVTASPRIFDLVLGRVLELVVVSVEGVRGRLIRGKLATS